MNLKPAILNPASDWPLAPCLRVRPRDVEIRFRMSRAERMAYRKRAPIKPSVWAERHRIITRGPYQGVKWRNRVAPYLPGIMDAADFPSVQTIIVCAAPQTGKSAVVDTFIGSRIDRSPGPVLYVYPDEDTASENIKDRIIPMIKDSPRLSSYLTGVVDDESAKRIKLLHMELYMAWARSASRLGNKTIRYVVFDECDKYPPFAGKTEADPFSLGEARTIWYRWSKKIWKVSTPTIEAGPIWQALTKEAEVRFEFEVKCPACSAPQIMRFSQIKWPDPSPDPETVESRHLAWYECEHCRAQWDDHVRELAVASGRWISRKEAESGEKKEAVSGGGVELFEYLRRFRPVKISFQIQSWLSRFVSLSSAASDFLRGKHDKGKLKHWANAHCAEPWLDYTVDRKENRILALRDDRPRGIVPAGGVVSVLTAAVDTQQDGFWYEIRAWGWGLALESWQVREGFVTDWDPLVQILFEDRYPDSTNRDHHVQFVVQDSMGGRTAEVYDFARLHRGRVAPYKGEQRMRQPIAWSKIDTYPGTNKPIPGGINLVRVDTTYYKNLLSSKLEVAPADPGAWHLHAETTEEYARHMCAEYLDEKQIWQCRSGHPNHLWDCSVMNLAAADILGVKFKAKQIHASGPRPAEQGEAKDGNREGGRTSYERPEWLNR